ncbi:MAG: leucine-rich repeat domain-containing protein, partial [Clostridia bacterium]|nr:leucine-rich repeat domain-containing protein [Clostridia bacterium]
CSGIKTINLNEGITRIQDYAFWGCSALETINLPSTLTSISSYAFYNCAKLDSVEIPGSVTYIGDYAFYGCKIAHITVMRNSTAVTVSQNTFTNVPTVQYFDYYSYTNGNNTFYYNVVDNNAIITKTVTTNTDLTLPTTLGGYTVTNVGNMGVANCKTLTSVVIPANISELCDYAFSGCTGLTTVTIPATCLHVGDYVFNGCTNITTTTIAEGVRYVGNYAFFNCSNLQEIVIPDSCEFLGQGAFYNCSKMQSATIGITAPAINDYTFMNCSSMETIVIGLSVTTIGDYAFKNCSSITRITTRNGVVSIGDGAFMNCTGITRVTLAASITDIGSHAFYGCSSLSSVTVPRLVTIIRESTFEGCVVLATASYNGTVETIEDRAFFGTAISAFNYKEGLSKLGSASFADTSLTNVTLPDSLTIIGQHVFDHCQLQTVSMPSCVKLDVNCIKIFKNNGADMIITVRFVNDPILDDYLLYMSGAKQVLLGEGITTIGDYTFAKNTFNAIELPNSLTDIGSYAFYLCEHISTLRVPQNVVTIGEYAFAKDFNLTDIYMPDSLQSIGQYALWKVEDEDVHKFLTLNIYYNLGTICDSLFITQHMQYVIVDNSVITICNSVFANCPNLRTVFVGNSVHTIGNNNFANCPKLETVSVSDVVHSFGQNNFLNDNSVTLIIRNVDKVIDDNVYYDNLLFVTTVIIENGITTIGQYAFYNDTSVLVMSVPNSVNYIGAYAFYNCNSIKEINIPNGVEGIYSHTFFGCASLESIVTPNTVKLIEDYAFYGCVEVKTLTISNTCESIDSNAFYNCKSVEELIIPDSVKYIGTYAFRSCVEITELDFSDNVEEVGACAFYDCNALETVKLGRKIIELKDRLFYGCVNLTSLYVYAPLSYIDELAFYGAEDVTVYCGRDDYMIDFFDENSIEYLFIDGLVYQYKVSFVTDNGEIISSAVYEYGATVIIPENPTKAADNTYTYSFKAWDKPVTTVGGNAEYVASFDAIYIDYAVVFKNYDGTVLSSTTYHYGDTVNIPATPLKPSDNIYTYAFKSWDKEIVNCSGNATYTATYDSNYIDYTVTFKNYDGTVLSTANYHYGDAVIEPEIPSKPADKTYTYAFKSWDKEVVNCIADAIYTATYNSTYIDYTVVFKNYDNTVLSSETYHCGESVVVPETPTKPADNTYTYAFKSWDKEVVNCVGDATYTATFNETYIEYTVTFKNYDGTVLSSETYHYGANVIVPSTPTKPSDNTYSYSFNGWDKTVVNCVGDAIYTATYSPNFIDYVVTFKKYNGDIISENTYHYGSIVNVPSDPTMPANEVGTFVFIGWDKEITACDGNKIYTANYDIEYIDYTVIFKNYDNTVLSTKTYHYGDSIVVPATPTKTADNTYTYSFKSWDKEVVNCVGNATYTATYDSNYIDYTVTFKNYDGTVLSSTTYHYGDAVNTSATPTKSADNTYTYTFKSWDKEVVNVVGDAIYTATYDATYIDYTIVFKNYDGTVLSSTTYHYGDDVIEPATPSKPADNTYTYSFKSWDKEIVNCIADATYTATYNSTYIDYTVIFKNYDNTVLSTKTYHYGESVIVPETPSKPTDNTYTYGFIGWDSEVVACNGNKTYIAQFTPTNIEYTVIFKNYNDVILSSTKYHYGDSIVIPATPSKPADNTYTYSFKSWDKEVVNCVGDALYTATFNETYIEYTVTFLNWDSSEIQKVSYHYGETIISIPNPERENDETYTYEFTSWNKPLGVCSGNTKFTAQYEATYINYTIIFKDQNDVILSRKNDYHYGDNVIKPNNPEKESNNVYTYKFNGWKDFSSVCIGNATYVPEFNEEYIHYSVIFKDYNGTVLSENTYHYGDTIVVPSNPTRSSDTQYSYTFNGWDKEISETCIGDAEYTATYTQSKEENVVPSQNGGSGCSGNVSAGDSAGNIIMSAGTLSIFFAIIIIRKKKIYNT